VSVMEFDRFYMALASCGGGATFKLDQQVG